VRQARQFLRNSIAGFDERKYGFASVVDLLRAAGKEGVVRIDRDRQGAVRIFPGVNLAMKTAPPDETSVRSTDVSAPSSAAVIEPDVEEAIEVEAEGVEVDAPVEPISEPPITDAETISDVPAAERAAVKTSRRARSATKATKVKKSSRGATSRARKSSRNKAEAADRR
jgi:hypothetical protein